MAAMSAILKVFKNYYNPNCKLDWAETWWEASEHHRESELLQSFRFDIQGGPYGGNLKNLQTMSAPERCQFEPNLGGRNRGNMEI